MKKILFVYLILLMSLGCSSEQKTVPVSQTQDNSEARQLEIDQIKEGDKLIKIQALLGDPTEMKSTQEGKEMIYWYTPAKGMKGAYRTLKEKPDTINEDTKFLKLKFNSQNILIKKEYNI